MSLLSLPTLRLLLLAAFIGSLLGGCDTAAKRSSVDASGNSAAPGNSGSGSDSIAGERSLAASPTAMLGSVRQPGAVTAPAASPERTPHPNSGNAPGTADDYTGIVRSLP